MGNSKSGREKYCTICQMVAPVLFRVKWVRSQQDWQFVCKSCCEKVNQNNPDYSYGGTWKAKKKR